MEILILSIDWKSHIKRQKDIANLLKMVMDKKEDYPRDWKKKIEAEENNEFNPKPCSNVYKRRKTFEHHSA